jgi:cellulose synthase/poly-beta-1,6-N-acetylglucosamine synthase-like glycosyltransferase
VHILERRMPDARQGKGQALNAALRYLQTSGITAGYDADDVVLGVLDADGRLQPNALAEIEPYFVADPKLAAVQIGVRMHNAHEGLLARMQDLEFVVYTELFERGRHAFGAAGLGGNGQFVRLSALLSLPGQPWTDCLTEDLDLGINLITAGWRTGFCPRTHVSQQAVVSLPRLLRQRSRWFQGHLQCWRRVPTLLATPTLRLRCAVDAVYTLTSPILVLLVSMMTLGFAVGLVDMSLNGSAHRLFSAYGALTVVIAYLLSAALTPLVAFVYWLRDRNTSAIGAVLLAHVYLGYVYLWVPAGWWAVCRVLRRRRGWAKTARTLDADVRLGTPHRSADASLEVIA